MTHTEGFSGAAAENEGSSVPFYLSMCPTRWPSDGAVILHVFERIHFVLFVTAFFYFFSLAVIYFLFVRRIKNYGYVEAAMAKARERSKADVEGASAELSTAEIELTALSDKPSMKRVQYHVLAMRSFVMSHAPEGSNADGRFLSVRAFLQRTTTADIDALISFPVTTFVIVGLGGLILASIFAATMSTADSQVLACTAAITDDIRPEWSQDHKTTKQVTLAVAVFATLISLVGQQFPGFGDSVFKLVVLAVYGLGGIFRKG